MRTWVMGTSISSLKNPGARECGRVPGGQKPHTVGGLISLSGVVFAALPAKVFAGCPPMMGQNKTTGMTEVVLLYGSF